MTAASRRTFPIRMLYAVTPQTRERAAAMGCNWALVYTLGHKAHRSADNPRPNDDLPIYFDADPRVAALRRETKKGAVEFERRTLRQAVDHAHRLGLKAMIHSYEVSLPPELRQAYPALWRPMVREYRNCCAETRANFEPCLSDPDVRELISLKIAETVRQVPDLDAYTFSFNECLSLTKVRHRCDICRDIPFPQMIQWLTESVREGLRRVNPKIRLFHRLWGLNEHDDVYHENTAREYEFSKGECAKEWMPAHVKVYAPRSMHYKPSEDLAQYLRSQRGTGIGYIAKATWADVSIDMPLNPWLKALKGHDTIVELSFESTCARREQFHVLADQFQRAAQFARDCGAAGLAGIPLHWGDKHNELPAERGFMDQKWWQVNMLNFDVIEALLRDPDVDMRATIRAALRKRYGAALPARFTDYVMESQHLRAGAINIRGIRAGGENIEEMHYQLLRYAPTVKGWRARLSRSPANLRRIFKEKDAVIARANAIVEDIRRCKGTVPPKAREEFLACFTLLRDSVTAICRRQKLNYLLWALKDGTIRCDIKTIHQIEKCL